MVNPVVVQRLAAERYILDRDMRYDGSGLRNGQRVGVIFGERLRQHAADQASRIEQHFERIRCVDYDGGNDSVLIDAQIRVVGSRRRLSVRRTGNHDELQEQQGV